MTDAKHGSFASIKNATFDPILFMSGIDSIGKAAEIANDTP